MDEWHSPCLPPIGHIFLFLNEAVTAEEIQLIPKGLAKTTSAQGLMATLQDGEKKSIHPHECLPLPPEKEELTLIG